MVKKIILTSTVSQSIAFFEDIIVQLSKNGHEVIVVTSSGLELDAFNQKHPNYRTIEVNMERRISLFKDIKALWQMIIVFHREKPDIFL